MRRGLKPYNWISFHLPRLLSFKPIPDEEGTETLQQRAGRLKWSGSFKPIPDEEGTETLLLPGLRPLQEGFKPIPDEEGTETRWKTFVTSI